MGKSNKEEFMYSIFQEGKKVFQLFTTNNVVQLEILSSIIVVTFILYISYYGLKYKKIQDVFCVHNPTKIKNKYDFVKNCIDAPLLSSNGIAMWRVYCSIPLAILTIIFYKNIVVSSILLQFYVFLFVTDALDGAVARKLNNTTDLGKVLDPFADKFLDLIILLIVCYYSYNSFFMIFAIKIVIFDILGQTIRSKTSNPAANKIGKIKTVFKVISIYIISLNRFDIFLDEIGATLLFISLVFTFLSFFMKIRNIK